MKARCIFRTSTALCLAPCLAFAAPPGKRGMASFMALGPAGMEIPRNVDIVVPFMAGGE